MTEQDKPSLSPQDILKLKDSLRANWDLLPPEHQASTILVLLSQLLKGDYGRWLQGALEILGQHTPSYQVQVLPIPPLSRRHLELANLTEEEIAAITDEDLRHITHQMMAHFTNDVFWEELEFLARARLAEKRDPT